jgi:hypothetical protein
MLADGAQVGPARRVQEFSLRLSACARHGAVADLASDEQPGNGLQERVAVELVQWSSEVLDHGELIVGERERHGESSRWRGRARGVTSVMLTVNDFGPCSWAGAFFLAGPAHHAAMATATAMLVELDRRLAAVADQLAVLMVEQPWQWERMCEREAAEMVALLQFSEAFPPGGAMVPQVTLGKQIIEQLVARHPDLCQDEVGSA